MSKPKATTTPPAIDIDADSPQQAQSLPRRRHPPTQDHCCGGTLDEVE